MPTRKRPQIEKLRNAEAPISSFLSQPIPGEDISSLAVAITRIQLPKKQPRRYFDQSKLDQLAESIKEHGILEPLLVRAIPEGKYELVAGERRLRAAQQSGLIEVPIVVRELGDDQALQVSLIENLQREDLNPLEETEGILELLAFTLAISKSDVISLLSQVNNAKNRDRELKDNVILQIEKVESVLATVGKFNTESFRVNRLPLLNLPEDVLEALRQGKLEYTKARAISRVKGDKQRADLLEDAIAKNLSLSEIKEQIAVLLAADAKQKPENIKQQFDSTYQQIKKSKVWDDPKKQRKLEKILADLRSLVES
jgi:ParB family transcriptional regulator, chromosome partitioning protein